MRSKAGLFVVVALAAALVGAVVPAVPASAKVPKPPKVTSTCGGTATNYFSPSVMPVAGPVAGLGVAIGIIAGTDATWTVPRVSGGKRAVVNSFAGLSLDSTAAATRIVAGVHDVGDNTHTPYVEFTRPGATLQFAPQLAVNAGDEVQVSVAHDRGALVASFQNHTTGATCSVSIAVRLTVRTEHFMWVGVERETSSDGTAKPLANFGTITFAAKIPAGSGNHWRSSIVPGYSIVSGSHVLAEPGAYDNGQFPVFWRRAR
jgi:hypothetical protein